MPAQTLPRSRRRSTETAGFVNWPISNAAYRCTGEGGMLVRLVVADDAEYDRKWAPCCGGEQAFLMDESFLGDDVHPDGPGLPDNWGGLTQDQVKAALVANQVTPANAYHFPADAEYTAAGLTGAGSAPNPTSGLNLERYLSRAYLAALTLGATGWSGHSEVNGYFRCTFDDLTAEGKALYRLLEQLYPGCRLFLQTWLDT